MPLAKVKENHRKKMEEMKNKEENKEEIKDGEAVIKAEVEIEEDYVPEFLKNPDALNENISKLSKKRETRKKKTSN